MLTDTIRDYFDGVAAKYLSEVDANPKSSNQHEIGGLDRAGFKKFLGEVTSNERFKFEAKLFYLSEEGVQSAGDTLTWYDSRFNNPNRNPEYRLYYRANLITKLFSAGDFFLIAKNKDGSLTLIFTEADSTYESQLRFLFGLNDVSSSFKQGELSHHDLSVPLRLLLEDLGVETKIPQSLEAEWLDSLVENFGGNKFPTTAKFSSFARKSLGLDTESQVNNPDQTLLNWMNQEEMLFRIYEKHLVSQKLAQGFGKDGKDVDDFISYSLSVQNRRKSRAGYAFERHLSTIMIANDLQFEQGTSKFTTENNKKPDFIFPSFTEYHNESFMTDKLTLLGAKTTCKDRWRQVLSEGKRISNKHLITLESAITESQTNEMKDSGLQLVVPLQIQESYSNNQQNWLVSFQDFICETKAKLS